MLVLILSAAAISSALRKDPLLTPNTTIPRPLSTASDCRLNKQAGLNPSSPKEKARRSTVYTLVELSVRQKTGRPASRSEYRSRSISTLTARFEAEKAVRQQGLEVWAMLDIQQITE